MRRRRIGWIFCGGHNALRRRVDRIEAAVLVGLAIFFVIAAPLLAVFAASLTETAGLREVRADSSFRLVTATLLANAGAGQTLPYGSVNVAVVAGKWTAPDGRAQKGLLATAPRVRAGSHVKIWVTKNGRLTVPPLTRADLPERTALAALTAVFGLGGSLSLIAVAVRLLANRRRMADWARAWAVTSPRWSRFR